MENKAYLIRLDEAVRRVHRLYPDGKICSCGKAVDNPMLKEHAPSCTELRELIEEVGKFI
jgi:hypothetical protein